MCLLDILLGIVLIVRHEVKFPKYKIVVNSKLEPLPPSARFQVKYHCKFNGPATNVKTRIEENHSILTWPISEKRDNCPIV